MLFLIMSPASRMSMTHDRCSTNVSLFSKQMTEVFMYTVHRVFEGCLVFSNKGRVKCLSAAYIMGPHVLRDGILDH